VNGFLVPVGDADAIAHAIERLSADSSLRTRMGAAARDKAINAFADTRVAAETLVVYRSLVDPE